MYRTHNCGELRTTNLDKEVELSGWVQKIRDKGFIMWVDLRDRYGITQLVFDQKRTNSDVIELAKTLGREFVINIRGTVIERASKNSLIDTGEVEVLVSELNVLNSSLTPPFTIENESDGGEELRMKYRYLDIRREPVKENLIFRHHLSLEVRNYLSKNNFIDVESGESIKLNPSHYKEDYLKRVGDFLDQLRLKCLQYKIDLVEVDINKGYDQIITSYLLKRQKMF